VWPSEILDDFENTNGYRMPFNALGNPVRPPLRLMQSVTEASPYVVRQKPSALADAALRKQAGLHEAFVELTHHSW